MTDDADETREWEPAGTARHRAHRLPARDRRVFLRLSTAEHAEVVVAARAAGLTPAGFAAQAALAAARGAGLGQGSPVREVLVELMAARTQVRRFGTNVNQAVAALHATGRPPGGLEPAVAATARAVARLDAATAVLTRRLR